MEKTALYSFLTRHYESNFLDREKKFTGGKKKEESREGGVVM